MKKFILSIILLFFINVSIAKNIFIYADGTLATFSRLDTVYVHAQIIKDKRGLSRKYKCYVNNLNIPTPGIFRIHANDYIPTKSTIGLYNIPITINSREFTIIAEDRVYSVNRKYPNIYISFSGIGSKDMKLSVKCTRYPIPYLKSL